ncbi:MAG: sprT domain-containing protein, partial [Flavobacteriales bacterium]|nr:sprT domain-containing protein [Flavobacteriales bacterium]
SLTLSKYDEIKKLKILNLNRGTEFVFNNQIFIKEEKLRKRYRCINKKNNKVYFFHPLAEISVLE